MPNRRSGGEQRQMPSNWDDHDGWENYYAGAPEAADPENALPYGWSAATRFARFILERGYHRLWFAGCGLDGATRVYASLGCEVWATDVSPSAVRYQEILSRRPYAQLGDDRIENMKRYLPDLTAWSEGQLHAQLHDFRDPFPRSDVDCILNIKAYQALPPESAQRAAHTFFAALRPGGHAFFDTQNVQGERRDRLEGALEQAGFVIPGIELERRLRNRVSATGIPHNVVLGRPFVWRADERYQGEAGSARADADQETLRAIIDEHREHCAPEAERVQAVWNDKSLRTASVVYNTG